MKRILAAGLVVVTVLTANACSNQDLVARIETLEARPEGINAETIADMEARLANLAIVVSNLQDLDFRISLLELTLNPVLGGADLSEIRACLSDITGYLTGQDRSPSQQLSDAVDSLRGLETPDRPFSSMNCR